MINQLIFFQVSEIEVIYKTKGSDIIQSTNFNFSAYQNAEGQIGRFESGKYCSVKTIYSELRSKKQKNMKLRNIYEMERHTIYSSII